MLFRVRMECSNAVRTLSLRILHLIKKNNVFVPLLSQFRSQKRDSVLRKVKPVHVEDVYFFLRLMACSTRTLFKVMQNQTHGLAHSFVIKQLLVMILPQDNLNTAFAQVK